MSKQPDSVSKIIAKGLLRLTFELAFAVALILGGMHLFAITTPR